jgi:hypothetical protein
MCFDTVGTTIMNSVSCGAKVEGVSLLCGYDTGGKNDQREITSAAIP